MRNYIAEYKNGKTEFQSHDDIKAITRAMKASRKNNRLISVCKKVNKDSEIKIYEKTID